MLLELLSLSKVPLHSCSWCQVVFALGIVRFTARCIYRGRGLGIGWCRRE